MQSPGQVWGDIHHHSIRATSLTALFVAIVGGAEQVLKIQSSIPFEAPREGPAAIESPRDRG